MDSFNKNYVELEIQLTNYLTEKKLRKTEERYVILKQICSFNSYFDICMLHQKLKDINFHVSKATLYNTLELFIDIGFLIMHQFTKKAAHYELKILTETHSHLICSVCGTVREIRDTTLKKNVCNLKIAKFTPAFSTMYIHGMCSKCKYRLQRERKNNINKEKI